MFTTFKRWRLKEGCHEEQVVALVREAILPAYQNLPGCLGLGLMRIEGTRSYLATQRWASRERYAAALAAESYPAWWAAYLPALEKWDALMALEDAWETVDVPV